MTENEEVSYSSVYSMINCKINSNKNTSFFSIFLSFPGVHKILSIGQSRGSAGS